MFDQFQKFSRAMMGAILFLPVIGTALVVATLLGNWSSAGTILNDISSLLGGTLWPLFGNLSLIFAVGLTYGLAKEKKTEAALLSVMVFIMFLGANSTFLELTGRVIPMPENGQLAGTGQCMLLGFRVIDMGVFLGILLGIITAYVHNKFCNTEFKGAMAMYGGTKVVFMVMLPVVIGMAIVLSYVWPFVASGITASTTFMKNAGSLGVFVYGFLEKVLIPTGLHHLVWSPFQLTSIGGTLIRDGVTYEGTLQIFFAEMANKDVKLMNEAIRFSQQGMVCMFGLVGAALAFYRTAKPEKKAQAKAILIPATLTAMLVGITEPIEFTFLFISPVLWVVYAAISGISQAVLNIFSIRPWGASGYIEFFLYNLPMSPSVTRWPYFILVGIVQAVICYYVFKFFVLKFNLKTPGREDDDEVKLYSKKEYFENKNTTKNADERIANIVKGLGGVSNIISVDNCFTRLRLELVNPDLVDEALLKTTGSSGVVRNAKNIQVIYGVSVHSIRGKVEKYIEEHKNDTL